MSLELKTSGFRCCFCDESIISDDINPCDVNVLINLDKPKTRQRSQTFYCHINCFKETMHPIPQQYFALDRLKDNMGRLPIMFSQVADFTYFVYIIACLF